MGRRAPVTEIMEAVLAEGIRMGGAKPISTLSSFLSHHPAFDNVRGEGYGLAEWKGVSPSASGNLLDRSQANPSMTPATTTSDSGAKADIVGGPSRVSNPEVFLLARHVRCALKSGRRQAAPETNTCLRR